MPASAGHSTLRRAADAEVVLPDDLDPHVARGAPECLLLGPVAAGRLEHLAREAGSRPPRRRRIALRVVSTIAESAHADLASYPRRRLQALVDEDAPVSPAASNRPADVEEGHAEPRRRVPRAGRVEIHTDTTRTAAFETTARSSPAEGCDVPPPRPSNEPSGTASGSTPGACADLRAGKVGDDSGDQLSQAAAQPAKGDWP